MGNQQAKECAALQTEILQMNERLQLPEIQGLRPKLRLLLVGPKGSGKTSLITSISAALSGNLIQVVGIRDKRYNVREFELDLKQDTDDDKSSDKSEIPASFTLCEFEGFDLEDWQSKSTELQTMIDESRHESGGQSDSPLPGRIGHLAMICLVAEASLFLQSGSREDPYINNLKQIKKQFEQSEIPKVLFLTKVDAFPTIGSNIKRIPKSRTVNDTISHAAFKLGMFPNRVFPVKNFTTERSADLIVSFQFLQILTFIMKDLLSVHKRVKRQLGLQQSESSNRLEALTVKDAEDESEDVFDDTSVVMRSSVDDRFGRGKADNNIGLTRSDSEVIERDNYLNRVSQALETCSMCEASDLGDYNSDMSDEEKSSDMVSSVKDRPTKEKTERRKTKWYS